MGRTIPSDWLSGVHVLVVEDDAGTRDLVRTILEYSGALVSVAAGAREAIDLLESVTPDVILSDISMPQEDGYWLIQQVRSLPPELGGTIPAVALTAHGETHDADRTLAAGFRAHLRKPVDPWELCRVLLSVAGKWSEGR